MLRIHSCLCTRIVVSPKICLRWAVLCRHNMNAWENETHVMMEITWQPNADGPTTIYLTSISLISDTYPKFI